MDNDDVAVKVGDDDARRFLSEIEVMCDPDAWDQPWTLWGLTVADGSDGAGVSVSIDLAAEEPTIDPWDHIAGIRFPDELLGVAIVTEGWTYPTDRDGSTFDDFVMVAPIEHPDRVEVRIIQVVLSDGRAFTAMRTRGSDLEFAPEGSTARGRTTDGLRRGFGLPTGSPDCEPGDLLTGMWLEALSAALVDHLGSNGATSITDQEAINLVVNTDPCMSALRRRLIPVDEMQAALAEEADRVAAGGEATVDPIPAGLRAPLAVHLGSLDGLFALAATDGFGPYTPEVTAWMGRDMFVDQCLALRSSPSEVITTIDIASPTAGALVRMILTACVLFIGL